MQKKVAPLKTKQLSPLPCTDRGAGGMQKGANKRCNMNTKFQYNARTVEPSTGTTHHQGTGVQGEPLQTKRYPDLLLATGVKLCWDPVGQHYVQAPADYRLPAVVPYQLGDILVFTEGGQPFAIPPEELDHRWSVIGLRWVEAFTSMRFLVLLLLLAWVGGYMYLTLTQFKPNGSPRTAAAIDEVLATVVHIMFWVVGALTVFLVFRSGLLRVFTRPSSTRDFSPDAPGGGGHQAQVIINQGTQSFTTPGGSTAQHLTNLHKPS